MLDLANRDEKNKEQRRKYDTEFKQQVLQMISNGRPVKEVAESLGIGENLIYCWRNRQEAREEAVGKEIVGATTDQQALLRRIRELETERDILKKSVGHFQPTDLKERYSFVQQHTE